MAKSKKGYIFLILIAILIISGYLLYNDYKKDIYTPVDINDNGNYSFQIKKGETIREIAANLEDKELIRDKDSFYLYSRLKNIGEEVIAGRFVLNKNKNVPEIIEIILDPSMAESVITIQEGLRARDIDEKLADTGLVSPGEFLNEVKNFAGYEYYDFLEPETVSHLEYPVEGYLYPDTYFLDPSDFQPHDLIYMAMDNFEKKLAEIDFEAEPSKVRDTYSLKEVLTMASIIENEVFGEEDRKIVSGILWKRLENGWTLGADATLLYITEDRKITSEDLEIDSPYNTRKNKGLPPGPISNPGIESIMAAYYPVETEYWFYLTTPDTGEVIYAVTNEEHNINRDKYLN